MKGMVSPSLARRSLRGTPTVGLGGEVVVTGGGGRGEGEELISNWWRGVGSDRGG